MTRRIVSPTFTAFLVAAALVPAAFAGGHATINVSGLPKSLVAGQPTTVEFTVHDAIGRPMSKLRPVLIATRGTEKVEVAAKRTRRAGQYAAAVALPSGGEWTLTLDIRYCGNTRVLRGVQVMAAATN